MTVLAETEPTYLDPTEPPPLALAAELETDEPNIPETLPAGLDHRRIYLQAYLGSMSVLYDNPEMTVKDWDDTTVERIYSGLTSGIYRLGPLIAQL